MQNRHYLEDALFKAIEASSLPEIKSLCEMIQVNNQASFAAQNGAAPQALAKRKAASLRAAIQKPVIASRNAKARHCCKG